MNDARRSHLHHDDSATTRRRRNIFTPHIRRFPGLRLQPSARSSDGCYDPPRHPDLRANLRNNFPSSGHSPHQNLQRRQKPTLPAESQLQAHASHCPKGSKTASLAPHSPLNARSPIYGQVGPIPWDTSLSIERDFSREKHGHQPPAPLPVRLVCRCVCGIPSRLIIACRSLIGRLCPPFLSPSFPHVLAIHLLNALSLPPSPTGAAVSTTYHEPEPTRIPSDDINTSLPRCQDDGNVPPAIAYIRGRGGA